MKEEISEYYKEKGFSAVYIAVNKEPRRVATLRKLDKTMTSMSYAKYLYTSYYKCEVDSENQVDHINGDKMDDRIENLQVISRKYNNLKDRKSYQRVMRVCPICGCEFVYRKRDLCFHPNPCCSRKCGGIKASITYKNREK